MINIDAADGILYAEHNVHENGTGNILEYPVAVVAGSFFGQISIKMPFYLQELLQFDGVYFQKTMEKMIIITLQKGIAFWRPFECTEFMISMKTIK